MENLNLLQELIARWKAMQPKLFKVITNISVILLFITGVPEMLNEFGITLPEWAAPIASKVVAIASLCVAIISKLTVATPKATEDVLDDVSAGVKPEAASLGK